MQLFIHWIVPDKEKEKSTRGMSLQNDGI